MRITGYPYAHAAQASPVRSARPRRARRARRRSMQISHSFLRTGEAKCSSCIEMRGKPHSKVVSRRECEIRSAGKTSTSWKELASATRTSTAASTAGLRPPVSSIEAVSNRFCRRRSVKSGTLTLTCVPPNPCRTGCPEQKQPTQRPRKDPLRVFLRPVSGS